MKEKTEQYVDFVREKLGDDCVEFTLVINKDGYTWSVDRFWPAFPEDVPDNLQCTRRNLSGKLIPVHEEKEK